MLSFKVKQLDIHQSYFVGKVESNGIEYTINVQDQRRGKVLKLPIKPHSKKQRLIVRFTGKNEIFVEDYLPYSGESEWLEIDSDEIVFALADKQDEFDTIEIVDE